MTINIISEFLINQLIRRASGHNCEDAFQQPLQDGVSPSIKNSRWEEVKGTTIAYYYQRSYYKGPGNNTHSGSPFRPIWQVGQVAGRNLVWVAVSVTTTVKITPGGGGKGVTIGGRGSLGVSGRGSPACPK